LLKPFNNFYIYLLFLVKNKIYMKILFSAACFFLIGYNAFAQNPATVISLPAGVTDTINITTGPCAPFTAYALNIKQNTDYTFQDCPYLPYSFASTLATEHTSLYTDDKFSATQTIPFTFCFYGQQYTGAVIGSNGIVTFDITNANGANSWPLQTGTTPQPIPFAGGTQNSAFSLYYPKASIMGAYYDIYPTLASTVGPTKKIESRVEGTAPNRRFVASYNNVRVFGSSCATQYATQQIVFYEGTGVVEIYIKQKEICTSWNGGLAILGMQDFTRTKAITAPGTNCTQFAVTDKGYRFLPAAGQSTFRRAQILCGNTVIGTADTSSFNPQLLTLTFNAVCPISDTCTATLRVVYGGCGIGGDSVVFTKPIFIKRPPQAVNATAATTNASCPTVVDGTITITTTSGTAPFNYTLSSALSTGVPQNSNTFTVTNGTYTVTVKDANGLTKILTVVVGFNNVITVTTNADVAVCANTPITMNTTSIGTSYNWSPATGVSNPSIKNPIITPLVNTQYIVTATLGTCIAKDTFNVVAYPLPVVDAGTNTSIILQDILTLNATSTPGAYLWTPSTNLNDVNILNPIARPQITTLYKLETTSINGCKSSDTVRITVIPYCIKPMQIFTPNGDGLYDKWLATDGACTKNITAQVFNRYGALVYESKDYKNTWDGTYKGKPLPDGTYYFVISFKLINDKPEYVKGNVTILR
jgi:gliding motility-associated-like protein